MAKEEKSNRLRFLPSEEEQLRPQQALVDRLHDATPPHDDHGAHQLQVRCVEGLRETDRGLYREVQELHKRIDQIEGETTSVREGGRFLRQLHGSVLFLLWAIGGTALVITSYKTISDFFWP